MLALIWAAIHKFREYLVGAPFTVLTDNNPLAHVMGTVKLPALEPRWVSALAPFDFTVTIPIQIPFRQLYWMLISIIHATCILAAISLVEMDYGYSSQLTD